MAVGYAAGGHGDLVVRALLHTPPVRPVTKCKGEACFCMGECGHWSRHALPSLPSRYNATDSTFVAIHRADGRDAPVPHHPLLGRVSRAPAAQARATRGGWERWRARAITVDALRMVLVLVDAHGKSLLRG
jgi:hypothetical protein